MKRCTSPSAPHARASIANLKESACTTASFPRRCAASTTAHRVALSMVGNGRP